MPRGNLELFRNKGVYGGVGAPIGVDGEGEDQNSGISPSTTPLRKIIPLAIDSA
jgi:hypothetical protein